MDSGGGGGEQQSSTTVQSADPWSGVQQPLTHGVLPQAFGGLMGTPTVNFQQLFADRPDLAARLAAEGPNALHNMMPELGAAGLEPYLQPFQTPEYFPGSTVVPFSGETEQALAGTAQRAADGSPLVDAAQGQVGDTLLGQYLGSSPAYGGFGQFAGGGNVGSNVGYGLLGPTAQGGFLGSNPAYGAFGELAGGGGAGGDLARGVAGAGTGPAGALFGSTAGGGFLNSNPWLDQTYDAAARGVVRSFNDIVTPGIAAQWEAAGGSGGGLEQNAYDFAQENLIQGLGDLSANIYGPAYESERNRMLQASGALQGAYESDLGRQFGVAGLLNQAQMGGASGLGGLYSGERGEQLGAAAGLAGLMSGEQQQQLQGASGVGDVYSDERQQQLAALSAVPGLAANDYMDLQQLMGVGASREDLMARQLQDEINRYNFGQQFTDMGRLEQFAPYFQSYGGGTTSGSTSALGPTSRGNPAFGALGGAGTGAYLGTQIYPGWGTAAGAGIGGLLGYFGNQ